MDYKLLNYGWVFLHHHGSSLRVSRLGTADAGVGFILSRVPSQLADGAAAAEKGTDAILHASTSGLGDGIYSADTFSGLAQTVHGIDGEKDRSNGLESRKKGWDGVDSKGHGGDLKGGGINNVANDNGHDHLDGILG